MQSCGHNMYNWSPLLLAVHLASATFVNTNLQAPLAAIIPNQLRIYKEYPEQHKYANAEKSEGLNEEEGQKILVNCTIRSINVANKETGKIIKKTTANCTVTHDGTGLSRKAEDSLTGEQHVNKMEEEISKVVDRSAMLQHANDSEPRINGTDNYYGSGIEHPEIEIDEAIEKVDRDNKVAEQLIPAIIGVVTSHSQDVSGIEERSLKVAVKTSNHTFKAPLSRSSKEEIAPAVVNTVQQNSNVGALKDTVQNAKDESILTFRRANNESILTQLVNESIQQNLNVTEQKSIDETTTALPLMDGSEHNASVVSENSMATEFPYDIKLAFTNTKSAVVRSDTDNIQRLGSVMKNTPKPFNQQDSASINYNYSFDNSGRLIEMQTPMDSVYRASIASEEPIQRQPENTTESLISKTDNNSTLALVKYSEDQNFRSTKKMVLERHFQGITAKSLAKFTEEHTQSASNVEDRSGRVRTIGSSQATPDLNNRPGQFRRAGDLKIPSLKVANNAVSRTGSENPIAGQVQSYPEQTLSQLNQRIMKYLNAEPTYDQNLGQDTSSYGHKFGLRQGQFPYNNPKRPAYVPLNQPSGTSMWDQTIWDTLKHATNNAHKGNPLYY